MASGGWNPVFGRDQGPRPPVSPWGMPQAHQNQAYIPNQRVPYGAYPMYPADPVVAYSTYPVAQPVFTYPHHPVPQVPPIAQLPGFPLQHPATVPVQPNGTGGYARTLHGVPAIDPALPAAQMTNSTGGVGCEPGYNYFFPAEHTKIHVFKCAQPPWQMPPNASLPFHAVHVPCNTAVADILKGFGATNPSPKKNRCHEVHSGGNGRWYKGMTIQGDDKDTMKLAIKDIGWDSSRTGQPGGKPVVCLWLTKD